MIRCSRLFSHVIESCLICSETPGQRKGRIRDVVVNEGEANPHSSYIVSARGLGGGVGRLWSLRIHWVQLVIKSLRHSL